MVGRTTGGRALAAEPIMLSITPPAVARWPILLAAPQPVSTAGGSTASRISAVWRGMFVGCRGLPYAHRLLAKDPLRRASMGAGGGGVRPGATSVRFHWRTGGRPSPLIRGSNRTTPAATACKPKDRAVVHWRRES